MSLAAASPAAPAAPSLARRVARNTVLLSGATLVGRLAMFALGVVLARELGVEDYGRYGLGLAVAALVVPLTDFGAGTYLAREVARSRPDGDAQLAALARARLLSAVVGNVVALTGLLVFVTDGRTAVAVALGVGSASLDGLATFAFGYFQGREDMTFQARSTTVTALARGLGGIVLGLSTGSLVAVLVWLLAVGALQAAWSAARLRGAVRASGRPRAVRPRWRTVVTMGLVGLLVMVTLRADSVLLGLLGSERQVGLYAAAWTIMTGLQIVPWTFSVALGPVFARTFATDRAAFLAAWRTGVRLLVAISLPLAVLVSVLSGPIVARVFGGAYAATAGALGILVWSVPLAALSSLATLALRGAGRERALTVVMATGAGVNVTANLWAIPAFGIDGAAAVNVATECLVFAALTATAWRAGVLSRPRPPLGAAGVAVAVLAAIAWALRDRAPVELTVVAASVGYAAAATVTGLVGRTDLQNLRRRRG